ncbi:MAG: response regulator transcription factor [Candidatus Gastranaerophilales bacterium]|nr:response regulator transcription factor [Candidatus Gastranaerophilales bacterium]
MKIYIVEDEAAIRNELIVLLKKYGYACESSDDFEHITDLILESEPDLVLVDINLPFQDGFVVCREIRKRSDVPMIVLTSRNTDFDELLSLNIGADDFISKPYHAQVLIARIQKILKRTYEAGANAVLFHKGLKVNLLRATMSCNDKEAELTKNELGILRLLILNKGNVIPRDAIMDELWQNEEFIDENTLNVNIVRLRKKLSEIGLPDYLETKRGLGYRV